MARTNVVNEEFKEAQQDFLKAAFALQVAWEQVETIHGDDDCAHYPKCLPSFDEFVAEVQVWVEASNSASRADIRDKATS